jgi:hypothetical protein
VRRASLHILNDQPQRTPHPGPRVRQDLLASQVHDPDLRDTRATVEWDLDLSPLATGGVSSQARARSLPYPHRVLDVNDDGVPEHFDKESRQPVDTREVRVAQGDHLQDLTFYGLDAVVLVEKC